MNDVVFKTVKEIADWLRTHYETELSFTDDTPDDLEIGEPSRWYGLKVSELFDGMTVLIGYYGDGILEMNNTYISGWSFENVICEFFHKEFGIENMNEDSLICVDANEWKGEDNYV